MATIGQLIEELRQRIGQEPSLFRAQLLREDVARLTKLDELAQSTTDAEAFKRAARRLGWTSGDQRTNEIAEPLDALFDVVFSCAHLSANDPAGEARIRDAWLEVHRARMERLVGCLATPVPKPVD
jgi:hypothetical protein